MLYYGCSVLGVMIGVGFARDIESSMMAKKSNFSLIKSAFSLTKAMAFFQPVLWRVHLRVTLLTDTLVSSVHLCTSFIVTFNLFVASLTNPLLAQSVSFGGWLHCWQVSYGDIFFLFCDDG